MYMNSAATLKELKALKDNEFSDRKFSVAILADLEMGKLRISLAIKF